MSNKTFLLDEALSKSVRAPMNPKKEHLSDDQKIEHIEKHIKDIMDILGLDITDDSIKDTPHRVAKMYIQDLFSGLNPKNHPKSSTFLNRYNYGEMLIEKNITVYSTCEHHLLPIVGVAHIGYISSGRVIGLSKINRVVNYYAKRPQVQERMTIQVIEELQNILESENVACLIDAKHLCVNSRGIKDIQSSTITSEYRGEFKTASVRKDFLDYIKMESPFNLK